MILLILAAVLAIILYNAYGKNSNWSGGWDNTPPQNQTQKCCCDDPNSYILQLPGQQCRCVKCLENMFDSILVDENGDVCCSEGNCEMLETTTTTLPCHQEGNVCIGGCGSGICMDNRGECVCMPDCNSMYTNGDLKVCYNGGCENPNQYCGISIDGRKCVCMDYLLA